jgi:hypothetical protein
VFGNLEPIRPQQVGYYVGTLKQKSAKGNENLLDDGILLHVS